MYGLDGRSAIVTGGAQGIGRAIVARLVDEGCSVGIIDVDGARAQQTARELAGKGRKIAFASGSVAARSEVDAAVGALRAELGPIDILVNNAGICPIGKVLEMPADDWHKVFAVNVDGTFNMCRAVVPEMVARRSGAVVNLASWMGKSGVASYGAYCASKFSIVALTQSLAMEVGEHGVRVNAVAPGLIVETRMRDESEVDRARQGLPMAADRAKSIPLRRAGLPDDVAKAVAFLASSEAAYITGETISVTGGSWND